MIKNVKHVELNITIATVFLNTHTNFKDDLIEYKCLCCNKIIKTSLKERLFNTYKFSNHDNKKFILLLRKGV